MYWTGVKMVVYVTRIAGEKVTVYGQENIPAGVCLFAANHTSNADAPAIVGAIPRRIAILGRKSLFDIPVVGTAFRLAKFVPVDRENRDAALESVKQAVQYIREGYSFLVYPEGTRSPDGRLRRFKKGSFVMAIEAGVPIVPVACAGAHRIMQKNSLIVRPGKVTVRFGKPIDASAFTIEQRDELAQLVHDAVAAELPEDQKPAVEGA
jgi:1-acyl-sn-glycerol-3-phosphate acyltransferase